LPLVLKRRQSSAGPGWCWVVAAALFWPLHFRRWALVCRVCLWPDGVDHGFARGHISGCRLNPAVAIGLWAGGRFPANQRLPYILAQVLGGIAAGGVLDLIASGAAGLDVSKGFACNGYGAHSPGGYSMMAALLTEVVMSMFFLIIIMGATDKGAPAGFAPIAIGLALTLIHLISREEK